MITTLEYNIVNSGDNRGVSEIARIPPPQAFYHTHHDTQGRRLVALCGKAGDGMAKRPFDPRYPRLSHAISRLARLRESRIPAALCTVRPPIAFLTSAC